MSTKINPPFQFFKNEVKRVQSFARGCVFTMSKIPFEKHTKVCCLARWAGFETAISGAAMTNQHTQDVEMVQRWFSVVDGGPTLNQHCFNVLLSAGPGKGVCMDHITSLVWDDQTYNLNS